MANVANTKHTGPASKNTVSGGKQFPIKDMLTSRPGGRGTPMDNTSRGAQSAIMSLKFRPSEWGGYPSESTFTSPKSK